MRNLWAEKFRGHARLEILTPEDPRLSGGITSFRMRGRVTVAENVALARELLERHGIFTVHRTGVARGACVRVTPALFNSERDIRRLAAALEQMI